MYLKVFSTILDSNFFKKQQHTHMANHFKVKFNKKSNNENRITISSTVLQILIVKMSRSLKNSIKNLLHLILAVAKHKLLCLNL